MQLILASTSPYRKQLLSRLGIPFTCIKPDFNEESEKARLVNENKSPLQIAIALSEAKAASVVNQLTNKPSYLIISGDQLVEFNSEILGKPGSIENAKKQLSLLNGKTHNLITCLSLFDKNEMQTRTEIAQMTMHKLTDIEIERYILKDLPTDCSGSYKIESYGIGLFKEIKTEDFTSIQGIPMLWLTQKLREHRHEFFRF